MGGDWLAISTSNNEDTHGVVYTSLNVGQTQLRGFKRYLEHSNDDYRLHPEWYRSGYKKRGKVWLISHSSMCIVMYIRHGVSSDQARISGVSQLYNDVLTAMHTLLTH